MESAIKNAAEIANLKSEGLVPLTDVEQFIIVPELAQPEQQPYSVITRGQKVWIVLIVAIAAMFSTLCSYTTTQPSML